MSCVADFLKRITSDKHEDFVTEEIMKQHIITGYDLLRRETEIRSTFNAFPKDKLNELYSLIKREETPTPKTALDLLLKAYMSPMVTTGYRNLDYLLNGGLPSNGVCEVYGETGSGKTQLCFQVAVESAKAGNYVIFIDTANSFSARRILELSSKTNDEKSAVSAKALLNIRRVPCFSVFVLGNILEQIEAKIKSHESFFPMIKLIIIDNFGSLFTSLMNGDEGRAAISAANNIMHDMAFKYNILFLVTNYTVFDYNSEMIPNSNAGNSKSEVFFPKQRALGKHWHGMTDVVLMIEKEDNQAKATVVVKKHKDLSLIGCSTQIQFGENEL